MLVLWTDGSAHPNPGPGGFAVLNENGEPLIARKSHRETTTNIRMEGWALIAAMTYARGKECEIHTDSQLWINILTKWAPTWEEKNWRKKSGEIKNLDLVKKAYSLYKVGNVHLIYVRGHIGIELNEKADYWAKEAREGKVNI